MSFLNELEMDTEDNIEVHIDKQEVEDDAFYSQFSQSEYQDFTDVTSMKSCEAYDSESGSDIVDNKHDQDFIPDENENISNTCEKIKIVKSSSENSLNIISTIPYENSINENNHNISRSRSSNELPDCVNYSEKNTASIEQVDSKNVLNSGLETKILKENNVLLKKENSVYGAGGDFHSRLTNIQEALKRLKFDIEQEKLFWRQELNLLFTEHLRHLNKFKNNEKYLKKDNLSTEMSNFDNLSNFNSDDLTIY